MRCLRIVGVWVLWLPVMALGAGSPVAFAEPIGSPASILKKGKWMMGLAGSASPERALDGGDATVYAVGHSRGYGLTDWLSLYGKIGGAYIEVDDPSIAKRTEASTSHSFGGNLLAGVQLKARLLDVRRFDWEWDGSVQYLDMRARHKGKNEGRWHEWQFATSVAKSFGRVKPYLGAKLSLMEFAYKVRENGLLIAHGTYHQDSPVGAFVGTDVYLGQHEDVILNLESSYLGGAELAVSIAYTF